MKRLPFYSPSFSPGYSQSHAPEFYDDAPDDCEQREADKLAEYVRWFGDETEAGDAKLTAFIEQL